MKKFFYWAAAALTGILLGFFIQPVISGDNIFQEQKKLIQVLQTANKNYIEDIDISEFVEGGIRGMLKELDPHSVYIPPKKTKEANEDFRGSFDGIGVVFTIIEDTITVISAIPGGPSDSLGIMSGDKIVRIDGNDAIGLKQDEVPEKLKGPRGTTVDIDIKRHGEPELLHFTITRAEIPKNSIMASFVVDGTDIGVIRMTKFTAASHDELKDSIRSLKEKGMKKLIFDLRGNPGGLLQQAILAADEFLHGGDTIVYTKGRKKQFEDSFISSERGNFKDLPLIVLIDAGSASASEIVSGAVQDLDRGLILGQTSFGKGLVQRPFRLYDGSSFRLTIAKYYTPSGRCIQRPYKDEAKYRRLAGRLNLEEGAYLEDVLSKLEKHLESKDDESEIEVTKNYVFIKHIDSTKKQNMIERDTLPIYYTKSGRIVLGGGGITPDYVVKFDTLSKLGRRLRNHNLYTRFIDMYLHAGGSYIKEDYKDDFKKYLREFEINDELMTEFKKFAAGKDIEWDEKLFEKDKDFIETMIKANIARSLWTHNEYMEIYYTTDRMVNKAKNLFPDAVRIANLNSN